jgi:hypothetical protein
VLRLRHRDILLKRNPRGTLSPFFATCNANTSLFACYLNTLPVAKQQQLVHMCALNRLCLTASASSGWLIFAWSCSSAHLRLYARRMRSVLHERVSVVSFVSTSNSTSALAHTPNHSGTNITPVKVCATKSNPPIERHLLGYARSFIHFRLAAVHSHTLS